MLDLLAGGMIQEGEALEKVAEISRKGPCMENRTGQSGRLLSEGRGFKSRETGHAREKRETSLSGEEDHQAIGRVA